MRKKSAIFWKNSRSRCKNSWKPVGWSVGSSSFGKSGVSALVSGRMVSVSVL